MNRDSTRHTCSRTLELRMDNFSWEALKLYNYFIYT